MCILKNLSAIALLYFVALYPLCVQGKEVRRGDVPVRGPIMFEAFDKNGDGFISEEEFNTTRQERMKQKISDVRGMRRVAEMPFFSEFDSNGDGKLSPEELTEGQKKQWEKRRAMRSGGGNSMGKKMKPGLSMRPTFDDYDLNKDGEVNEAEFNEARSKRVSERAQMGYKMKNLPNAPLFTDIDTDNNGLISAEEFSAHQMQRCRQNPGCKKVR